MSSVAVKSKKVVRASRKPKTNPMTKLEMVQKMLADQKIIGDALQKGISLEQLEKTHGFKFARLPYISNK